jgi:hypothetical protein
VYPQGRRVGSKFSKSFFHFSINTKPTESLQCSHIVCIYIVSLWKNQMSNVSSDFNLIDFRTSGVPNILN